jgi:hypothetical protein
LFPFLPHAHPISPSFNNSIQVYLRVGSIAQGSITET